MIKDKMYAHTYIGEYTNISLIKYRSGQPEMTVTVVKN